MANKQAIKALETQALEAVRQASEPGITPAARESCLDTALACMRAVDRLQPPAAAAALLRAKRKPRR